MSYMPRSATDARYVDVAGDTMTGNLTVQNSSTPMALSVATGASDSYIGTIAPAGRLAQMYFGNAVGNARWVLYKESTTESGSNAGSNLNLDRFNDAGNYLGSAFSIARATGNMTLAGTLTLNSGGPAITVNPGSQDCAYISFYARTATPGTLTSWIGCSAPGDTSLNIVNLISGGPIALSTSGNGNITLGPSGTGRVVLNADPTSALHAATKQYVDTTQRSMTNLTPASGWVEYGGAFAGLYCTKSGGMVTLEVLMKPTATIAMTLNTSYTIATIPSGYLPGHEVMAAVLFAPTGGASAVVARVGATSAGVLYMIPYQSVSITTAGWVSTNMTYRWGGT